MFQEKMQIKPQPTSLPLPGAQPGSLLLLEGPLSPANNAHVLQPSATAIFLTLRANSVFSQDEKGGIWRTAEAYGFVSVPSDVTGWVRATRGPAGMLRNDSTPSEPPLMTRGLFRGPRRW